MGWDESQRTEIAGAGVVLSDRFSHAFYGFTVPGDTPRKPTLLEPEGPSTMGGAQARQHITLEPERREQRTLTVGWASIPEHRAQLRTFNCLVELHRQRFKKVPFDVDPAYFQIFFERAQSFFSEQGFLVEVETRPPLSVRPAARSWRTVGILTAVAIVALLAAAAACWYLY